MTKKPPTTGRRTPPPPEPSKKDPWKVFLSAVRKVPDRSSALTLAGLSHHDLSTRLRDDKDFAAEFSRAFEVGIDSMEDEVVRRAIIGVDEPVFQQGMIVGHKTKYSDTLLMFFLEANRKKYRSGDDSGRRALSDEAKNTLRTLFSEIADEVGETAPPSAAEIKPKRGRPRA